MLGFRTSHTDESACEAKCEVSTSCANEVSACDPESLARSSSSAEKEAFLGPNACTSALTLGRPCDDRYGRQDLEQELVGTVQQVERQVLDKVKHSIRVLTENGCSAEEIL